ncbi:MAG: helix-turn-helix transcriptional regulator, partial [Pseudomonadota bacterium]
MPYDSDDVNIDKVIGERIRERRISMGLTQDQIGDALGISYQQVQKYETGTNRVSASRLFEIACLLEAPVSNFFPGEAGASDGLEGDFAPSRHMIELVRKFSRIENQKIRSGILALVRSVADECAADINALADGHASA